MSIETPTEDERFEKLRAQRRFITVPVDVRIFGTMLVKGIDYSITVEGLPEDAIFVTVEPEARSQSFCFIYMHESFEPVQPGVHAPLQDVILTRHDK